MNDYSEKMASSLALVEKRNQRPGGCVGIFSQLFDWNKRFAKKKLFSKELLPPVRLKKASKIFGRDEKQPKLRLIAVENSEGFPCMKNNGVGGHINSEGKHEIRIPGLVARLMGLESMPAVQRDKLEKYENGTHERGEFCVQKAETKNALRPQKIQKTGLSDRRPVSKLEDEAFQLKNVLSRSKKRHHKLVSPVNSPGNLSGKSTARLVGAATRILEPRLQRNRPNSAISYSNLGHNSTTNGFTGGASESSNDLLQNSHGQSSSCRSNDHLLDAKDFTPNPEGQHQVFSSINIDHSRELQRNQCNSQHYASLSTEHGQPNAEFIIKQMCSEREGQRQRKAISIEDNIWKDGSSFGLKHNVHGERQMFKGRKNLPSRSKLSKMQSSRVPSASTATNDTGSSIALDRDLSCHARSRVSTKEEYCELDARHNIHPSVSHVRKRRSDNISGKIEGPDFVDSSFSKPAYARSNVISGRDTNSTCLSCNLVHPQESANHSTRKSQSHDISSSFNSQIKQQNTGINSEVDENVGKKTSSLDLSSNRPALHEDGGVDNKHEYFPLDGDNLGAFLQEKLRELTSHQEENESAYGDASPRKTVAVILQELISALTRGRPCHHDYLADELQKKPSYFHNCVQSKVTSSTACQEREHFSPGSVLEGAFSNDSFVSSSLDDNSKYREETVLSEPDADLLVSTTSSSMGMLFRESITALTKHISEALSSIDFADVLLKGKKLVHAKEVILNAEMVFGNAAIPSINLNQGFSICSFVQNELETIVGLMWARFRDLMGCSNTRERHHQLKGFVFDCMIEYLETRFSRYSNTGFNAWTRLPLRMKTEMLTCEIVEEVGRWIYMSGLSRDELIEYEMSHNLGKWIDFDLEAFETGMEIDHLILDVLVDEIVFDVVGCRKTNI